MMIGAFVSCMNSERGTAGGLISLPPRVMGGGASPSGKGKSKPGS